MNKKTINMEEGSIGKLLLSLAIPTIIAQLVNILYNIVDRIFIGKMADGELAMAGIGVAMPITLIITACCYLIGFGGAPLAAIKMGEKDNDSAEKILGTSFSALFIFSFILTFIFMVFKKPILIAFGASNATLVYGLDYVSTYILGTIFVLMSLGLNSFINTQGFTKIGMISVAIGAIINIILDPVFIFVFDMGVKGAALASIIGQLFSAIWVLSFLFSKKSLLKIRKKYLSIDPKLLLSILALGVSPFIMQATESLVLISLNNQLSKFGGDIAVSAMTIMSSLMLLIIMPVMGLTQGAQPLISYNYGAKNIVRVKKAFKLLLVLCIGYTSITTSLLLIWPTPFVHIFNSNPELVKTTTWAMRYYFAGMIIFGGQIACQQTFLALGQAKISLLLALLRKVILLVPLIFILPLLLSNGLQAVLLAEPIADILAALTTMTCFTIFYKTTLSKLEAEPTSNIAK